MSEAEQRDRHDEHGAHAAASPLLAHAGGPGRSAASPRGSRWRLLDGQGFRYDKLIVATGADTYAGEVPGLAEHAATIWTTQSMLEVRRRFGEVRDRRGAICRRKHPRLRPSDRVPAVRLRGALRRAAVRRAGLRRHRSADRLVMGRDDVYAPGDAGDFPIKQAFLAFLQADAVAAHIAAEVERRPFSQPFDPVSMCIMEMFDKATFAQVPVELTGDPAQPVRVRPGADGAYKVGTSPLWRLGKKTLGFSVPMRFAAGDPFHAGRVWQGMDLGIKAMSRVLAD